MDRHVQTDVRMLALEQRVIRKDGRVEDLGVTAYHHVKRICRWCWQVERGARRLREYFERRP